MYDAVAESVPMAQGGEHRKKAILIVSDGNDTNSRTSVGRVEADDSRHRGARLRGGHRRPRRDDVRRPAVDAAGDASAGPAAVPDPRGGGGRGNPWPQGGRFPGGSGRGGGGGSWGGGGADERVNVERAARTHRRQRRPHRDRPLGARPRSGHGQHRRRAEQAVLHRLSRARIIATGAGTRFVSKSPSPATRCGRGAATAASK